MKATATRRYEMKARAQAAEETWEAILDTGIEAFGTRRYDDVTLHAVAEGAGVSEQTVIRRFGSKAGLFDAVVGREREHIARRRDVPAGSDLADAIAVLVGHYEADGRVVLHFLSEESRSAEIAAIVQEGRAAHRSWVEQHLSEVFEGRSGEVRRRVVDAAVVATDLYTWKLLRLDMGRSAQEVAGVMVSMLRSIARGPR